jgi:hypothetical protein
MYSDDTVLPWTLALEFSKFICVGFLKLSYLFYFVLKGIPPPFFWRPSDSLITTSAELLRLQLGWKLVTNQSQWEMRYDVALRMPIEAVKKSARTQRTL